MSRSGVIAAVFACALLAGCAGAPASDADADAGEGSGAKSVATPSPSGGSSAPPAGETQGASGGVPSDPAVSDDRLARWRAWAEECGAGADENGSTPAELPDDPAPTDPATGLTPCEMQDALSFAEQEGVPPSQIVFDQAYQEEFTLLTTELRERFPDSYAGARFTGGRTSPGWIEFTGEVPEAARQLVREQPFDVELRGGADTSERAHGERIADTHYRVRELPEVAEAVSGPGSDGDGVTVTVELAPGHEDLEAADIREKLPDELVTDDLTIRITDELRAGYD